MDDISVFENEVFMRHHSSPTRSSNILKIIPGDNEWISVWNIIDQLKVSGPSSTQYSRLLFLAERIFKDDNQLKQTHLDEYKTILQSLSNIKSSILIREVNYNQSNLFLWSLIFYIIS